ncbi:MAG: inner membrane protein YiaA [Bacteroidota bacterium]
MITSPLRPTPAYVGAAWIALLTGTVAFMIGLWNAEMMLNEKGYYLTVLLFGLFGVISLQKSVRDRLEGIEVTTLYFGLCWVAVLAALVLLVVGLFNAKLALSEKGFYGMSFVLALFGAVTVQKNVRDLAALGPEAEPATEPRAGAPTRDPEAAFA